MGNSLTLKQTVAFLLLFVPALIFYALQNNVLNVVKGTPLQTPAHWVQLAYDEFTHLVQESLNTYFYLVATNRENKVLKIENAKLASKVQLLEEYRSENIRLRDLFKFQQELPRETIAARVISKDISNANNSFTIDKGSEHGVKRLQGVISANGIVGYTFEVEPNSSRVLLLSNQNASIDALIQRTRARGIVSGINSKTYELKYLMRKEDAQPGDRVVTSGRKGFFPKGFIIGEISEVRHSPTAVSFRAEIKPAVKIDQLEHVLVIVDKKEGLPTESLKAKK
jgi:rod shape-determining protein MreC